MHSSFSNNRTRNEKPERERERPAREIDNATEVTGGLANGGGQWMGERR
jgi:hypothetical protein